MDTSLYGYTTVTDFKLSFAGTNVIYPGGSVVAPPDIFLRLQNDINFLENGQKSFICCPGKFGFAN